MVDIFLFIVNMLRSSSSCSSSRNSSSARNSNILEVLVSDILWKRFLNSIILKWENCEVFSDKYGDWINNRNIKLYLGKNVYAHPLSFIFM